MSKDYKKQFNEASLPRVWDLAGNFDVKIMTGISHIPKFFCKSWKKRIINGFGTNIIQYSNRTEVTGFFVIRENNLGELFLDYSQHNNPIMWRRLTDYMRMIDEDTFIGKIYFKFYGKNRFLGYFYLIRENACE